MKTLKTFFCLAVVSVVFASCTVESLDEDETLVNNTEVLATNSGDTGGVVDTDSGQGGD